MKLISLNIWGGREFEALTSFIRMHAESTDVFCFQEVFSSLQSVVSRGSRLNILEEIKKALPNHETFFAPIQDNIDEEGMIDIPSVLGQAIFAKKDMHVEGGGFVFTYGAHNTMKGNDFATLPTGFQHIRINKGNTPIVIVSVHGLSRPVDKLDTPERLMQSQQIQDFLATCEGKKIVCGDFNLMPETTSITMLEANMENLIKTFHISDTRGPLNRNKYPSNDPTPNYFADYCFVSSDINVISFEVPNVAISDHLPLVLEFS